MELTVLKSRLDLSNKQWDKALKSLANHKLSQVWKADDGVLKIKAV
jgi:hypothetical protein